MAQYIERLDTESLDTANLYTGSVAGSLGLPTAKTSTVLRHVYRATRRLLRSIIARIDLSQFPGSCCG